MNTEDRHAQYRYDMQTAVMDALPAAIHPLNETWRDKADALIKGLEDRGWMLLTTEVYTPGGQKR